MEPRENVSVIIISQRKENAMENVSNNWIDSVAVKDYLDALVDFKKREVELSQFGGRIELAGTTQYVHIYKGIREMAAAVGAKIKEDFREKQIRYPYQYSFIYNGIEFLCLSEERITDYENV